MLEEFAEELVVRHRTLALHELADSRLDPLPRVAGLAGVLKTHFTLPTFGNTTNDTQRVGQESSDMRSGNLARTDTAELTHDVLIEHALGVVAGEDLVAGVVVFGHGDVDADVQSAEFVGGA